MSNTEITICGIGPGNADYICPAVLKQVAKADILIGGSRHLQIFDQYNKATDVFTGNMENLKHSIAANSNKHIVVLVSGDAGFYSLRSFIKSEFADSLINIIPGISSYQYMYAKLGMGYERAFLASMHGKEVDYIGMIDSHESVFLLTDKKNTPKAIAQNLVDNGLDNVTVHIGNNLSYPDEQIISCTAQQVTEIEHHFDLCSVIIENN